MEKRKIHVGILISYDYKYLPICLQCIYNHADKITLAIDKNRCTWAGNPYNFDETFLNKIIENDERHIISIYEDDFSDKEKSTIECEKEERRKLKLYMQSELENAWHIQLDTDEYFLNFKEFVEYLHEFEQRYSKNVTIHCKLITIFKQLQDGYAVIRENKKLGYFPVASWGGVRFSPGRNNIDVKTDFQVLHQSWAREDDEINFKIKNWGHNEDFDTERYFKFWQSINKYNIPYIHLFHPRHPNYGWDNLEYVEGDIQSILDITAQKEQNKNSPIRGIINAYKEKITNSSFNLIIKSPVIQKFKPQIKRLIGKS